MASYRDYVPGPLCDYLSECEYDPCFPPISVMAKHGYLRTFRHHQPKNLGNLPDATDPAILKHVMEITEFTEGVDLALHLGYPQLLKTIEEFLDREGMELEWETIQGDHNTAIFYLKRGIYDSTVLASAARSRDLELFTLAYILFSEHYPDRSIDFHAIIESNNPKAVMLLCLIENYEIDEELVGTAFQTSLEMLACIFALDPESEAYLMFPEFVAYSHDPRVWEYFKALNLKVPISGRNVTASCVLSAGSYEQLEYCLARGYPLPRDVAWHLGKRGDIAIFELVTKQQTLNNVELVIVFSEAAAKPDKSFLEYLYTRCQDRVSEVIILALNDYVEEGYDVGMVDWLHSHGLHRIRY